MGFLYSQLFKSLPYPAGSYVNQTIVITGSNTGLGKEAARHYARLGASRLILAVRNLDKGYDAKYDIEATTKCDKNVIQVWQIDMSSYASVQKFAARVEADLDRVDIFIANAGVARAHYATAEGNEEMITVNVVSTFLLAALVMPKLKTTAATFKTHPVLTVTSSSAHVFAKFPQRNAPKGQIFSNLNDKETAEKDWDDQYPISKMLEIFVVRSIGEKYPAPGFPVTVNCVDPGLCHSELSRDFSSLGFWFMKLIIARSTESGSRSLVHAGAQGAETHGQYLSDCEIAAPAALITSEEGKEVQGKIWDELTQILDKIKPGVTNNF